jgi:vesicular inhibitory amino acid transporter
LGVPYAVSKGGYLSLVAIVLIAVVTNYTGKLIIECLYEKPLTEDGKRGRRLRKSYAELGEFYVNCIF